jgi:hypothetical protein
MKQLLSSLTLLAALGLTTSVAAQAPAGGLWVPVPAKAQSAPILIKSATVHVGTGQVLERTDVLVEGGKITQVGVGIGAPAGAQVIDGAGQHLYPGLIGVGTTVGLVEISAVRQTNDTQETGEINPNVRAVSSFNMDSHVLPVVKANGVLLVQATPDGDLVAGQSAIMQLDAWNYEDATVVADDALHITWPVQRGGRGPGPIPGPPGAPGGAGATPPDPTAEAIRKLNEYFDEAAAYAAARKAGSPVKVDLRLEAMIAHVEGRKSVFFAANDGSQIAQVVDFATRHKLRAVIIGGTDAWRVAPLLAKSNIPVVLRNSHELPNRLDEDYDLPYKTAALLKAAGVNYCLSGALDGFYQIQNLPFQAGTLAAFGLSKEEALASVTLNAAKILGIDSRVGSIEVGKDATLVLSKGDLLDMRTSIVTTALIAGRNVDLSNKHKALYNRFQQKYGEK